MCDPSKKHAVTQLEWPLSSWSVSKFGQCHQWNQKGALFHPENMVLPSPSSHALSMYQLLIHYPTFEIQIVLSCEPEPTYVPPGSENTTEENWVTWYIIVTITLRHLWHPTFALSWFPKATDSMWLLYCNVLTSWVHSINRCYLCMIPLRWTCLRGTKQSNWSILVLQVSAILLPRFMKRPISESCPQ